MKRIITCSDGTWNKPNTLYEGKLVRTNVQKLFDYILKKDERNVKQIKYYDEGVGARGNFIQRLLNGATGGGIDENIQDAYKFIAWNYEPEDDIYLFGFSRGAYTARSLAGFIRKCGIIIRNDLSLIEKAYAIYRDKNIDVDSPKAVEFRKKYSNEPRIKFVGVWDTVGALGIPLSSFQMMNKTRYCFHDTTLSSIVDHAYHALAIDEQRKNFEPTLWQQSARAGKREVKQVIEQRWFSGVHSNIGGGYPDERLGDISLNWMLSRASSTGLAFDKNLIQQDVKPDIRGKIYNSRSGIFSLTAPFIRTIDKNNSIIDESVIERMKVINGYKPSNVL